MTTKMKLTSILCAVVFGTITFFTNQIATAAETDAQSPKIETRTFKVDPNIFYQNLGSKFEVIGEALNRLRKSAPAVAAKISSTENIIAFRNRIIHGYDSVDDLIVWNTVQNDLPTLRIEVEKFLG
jgi:uncharacterized protein with HEPN domain